jgi:hypothetical protein
MVGCDGVIRYEMIYVIIARNKLTY